MLRMMWGMSVRLLLMMELIEGADGGGASEGRDAADALGGASLDSLAVLFVGETEADHFDAAIEDGHGDE